MGADDANGAFRGVQRADFDDYIRRFNAQDATAFDDYIHPELRMQNGGLVFHGVQGMKDHYAWIWRTLRETLNVRRFVTDEASIAVEMHTHFEALHATRGRRSARSSPATSSATTA